MLPESQKKKLVDISSVYICTRRHTTTLTTATTHRLLTLKIRTNCLTMQAQNIKTIVSQVAVGLVDRQVLSDKLDFFILQHCHGCWHGSHLLLVFFSFYIQGPLQETGLLRSGLEGLWHPLLL